MMPPKPAVLKFTAVGDIIGFGVIRGNEVDAIGAGL